MASAVGLIRLYTFAIAEFPDNKIDGASDNNHQLLRQIWDNIEPAMQINFYNCWRLMLHANVALGNMQNLSDAARAVARQNLVSRLKAMAASFDMVYQAGYLNDKLEDLIVGGWLDKHIRIEQGNLDVLTAALRDAAATAPPSNSAASDPEQFFPAKFLGEGTYGDANLFLRQNSGGNISDRVVIKKSEARPGVPWLWAVKDVPNEVTAMESLQACKDSDNIVKLRNWAIREDKAEYELYMEFCEHGDLNDFTKGYDPNRLGFTPAPAGVLDYIPEPFAWSVFEGLVKAGLLMLQGDTESPDDDWKPMVHRDIKTANVFLGKNTTNLYRHYPIAKLGDFGLTVFPQSPQPRETRYAFKGKTPYMPPELCNARILRPGEKNPGTPGPKVAPSEKTNVWMVGHTMWAMLSGKTHDVAYLNAMNENGLFSEEKAPRRELNDTRYSQALRDAIYACVNYQPDTRPTFSDLYDHIRQNTRPQAPTGDLAMGLRRASANLHDSRKVPLKLRSDFFAVGSKVALPGGGTIPAPPPARTISNPPTPDDRLFGHPGRTYLVPAPPPISGQGAKRDAPDEGEGGPPQRRRTEHDATPTSAARGGASPGGSAGP